MFEFELPERFRRYVPLAVWMILAAVLLLIPFKIIGYGYLPGDDALRHCAKAVSGKPWPEIIVVGETFKLDHNLGWHAILGWFHRAWHLDAEGLLVLSVVGLFLLINAAMLPWLKRPEAWLAVLLTAMIVSDLPQRWLLGRPFILTSAALMTILFLAQKFSPSRKNFLLCAALVAACTSIHGVWYLWLLPIAAFAFAGQFRWSLALTGAWLLGTGVAMLVSGHPADYLINALQMALNGVNSHLTNRTQVAELQPFAGDFLALMVIAVFLGLRLLTRPGAPSLARSPAFWLMCGCWILGFRVSRFWEDWGWPALTVLLATELDFLLLAKFAEDSFRRLLLALILAAATFACVTNDLNGRWTNSLQWQFLSEKEHPDLEGWMPDKGGILYSADMGIFYQTFYKNPHADWRYILGYEPALMPAEDFKTYHGIYWNNGEAKAYEPWVEKMKPADRLVIRGSGGERPNLPQLEWHYAVSGVWVGRLPATGGGFRLKSLGQ